jgi:uncharacterized protein YjbJ (UPF0337 family)
MIMNKDTIEGTWEQLKGKIQQQWGKFTKDNLDIVKGNSKILAGKIQERYGISKDEAEDQYKHWSNNNH